MHHMEILGCHFNFNGDFSGNVEIADAQGKLCSVPFDAIKALVGEYIRRGLAERIEDAPGGWFVDRFLTGPK